MSICGSMASFSLLSEQHDNETATIAEDAVHGEIARLRMENELLKMEMKDRKAEVHKTNEPAFKSSLSGSWKIVASKNMTDYLKAQKGSDLFNTVFQLANVHLEFHDNAVSMYHQVGEKKYHEKPFVLSEAQLHDTSACVTYICDNILKTVFLKYNDEKQEAVEKRYIVGGRLHVMMKRNGVACERVYERIVQPRRGWFW